MTLRPPSFQPGQYHLRKQMGSGNYLRLRIVPSAYADGTDSGAYAQQLSNLTIPSFANGARWRLLKLS